MTFKNRLMMAPMGSAQSDREGFVTDQTVAYYRRRAEGGVGAITVEAALVDPASHGHEPRLHGEEFVPGMTRLAETIAAAGCVPGLQLMHPGRQVTSGPVRAPSAVALNSASPIPTELSAEEIATIVRRYATAATYAARAGFRYVEVHGAHGYLPSDFLSPAANLRDDGYGGDPERRLRFALEVSAAIRAAVDIPLFWRLSGEEGRPGGFTIEDQIEVARALERAGTACISVSAGSWNWLEPMVAPMYRPHGHIVEHAARIKAAVDIPVIAVGRLDDPATARSVIAEGRADFVLLGRGLLADPDWPRKVESGAVESVRPCIACNACVELVAQGEDLRCAVNPETGRESDWDPSPAARPRRVMVVGSGPAGLESARLARLRGHQVSIWERDPRLGGKLHAASSAPSKREVRRFLAYEEGQLAALGVEVHDGTEVDAATVADLDPEVVVVAVGADAGRPPIDGIEGERVVDAEDLLLGRVELPAAGKVVVVGGSATGCETAEMLAAAGAEVTIVEMLGSIGRGIEQITRRNLVRQLRRDGVRILTRHVIVAVGDGSVVCRDLEDESETMIDADAIALATGWSPRGQVFAEAIGGGREILTIGDAESPGDFVAATGAAARVALAL